LSYSNCDTNSLFSRTLESTESSSHSALICFSHLRWHFVTQRPQHLLTLASETARVFYWEEPVWLDAGENYLEVIEERKNLWVVRPHLARGADGVTSQRLLLDQLLERFSIKQAMRWYYTPMALAFSRHLVSDVVVYDCMDELTGFLGAPPELSIREQELFSLADVVFTGGMSLFEAKRKQHANVHAFPSSIDAAHFVHHGAEAEDQAGIAHPRAGFYGVIDERFDIGLLADVARSRTAVQFIILGPVVKIDPSSLPQASNIHYLGPRNYQELPKYLAGWDVALLPFALNDATRFISPTKTPEYLAAGKPVVSTAIRDVVLGYGDAGLVAIAQNAEAFAEAIDRALEPRTEMWRVAVAAKLAEGSWSATWEAMRWEISRVRTAKQNRLGKEKTLLNTSQQTAPATVSSRVEAIALPQRRRVDRIDYLVVGAGFAGSVLAERIATQLGKRVLVVDKREHVAGNAYDCLNSDGILIHKYGPHIFHTNSDKVVAYLSRFTQWRPYEHRVLSQVDGQLLPVPINLNTINKLYGLQLDAAGMEQFLASRAVMPTSIRTSEEVVISRVGRELYEKFFRNYTRKQWGLDPSQLDASVAGRIPVRFNRDDRYFTDSFQAMPLKGYTYMFERMLDHPNITRHLGVSYAQIRRTYPNATVIYTGAIDEYFGFCYGALPYRSLEFKHETHDRPVFQPAPVVNYPNEQDYTRVTEFKYLTGQQHAKTSIVYEYPRAQGDPYYPIPRPENAALYAKYRELAERDGKVHFCGRLANYRYLNMDQVVAQALTTFRQIEGAAEEAFTLPPQVSEPHRRETRGEKQALRMSDAAGAAADL
jgi:UDP-galactopyranose mutase